MTPPQIARALIKGEIIKEKGGNNDEIRNKPYPPNLRRIPARIMDPATGASTWAFGSHKWTVYIGILTKNAITVRNHHKKATLDDKRSGKM